MRKLKHKHKKMSEELQARGLLANPPNVAGLDYLIIGATTLNQLKRAGFVPDKDYSEYSTRKPDRLLVDRSGNTPSVLVVVEDKESGKFSSERDVIRTIQQCNDVCQEVNAKIGVATDGQSYYWFNPNHPNSSTEYQDVTTGKTRSFTLIDNSDGSPLSLPFLIEDRGSQSDINQLADNSRQTILKVRELIDVLGPSNSTILPEETIDPLPLARRVWQDIWVATGKTPEKCLYNVVELFIFKFLSDLEVLRPPEDFNSLYNLYSNHDSNYVLDYYARVCRPKIFNLFPKGNDGTTIVNGTIFVENDQPVFQTSILFRNSLKKFKDFGDEYGSFKSINKDFKTKLYENFLKQSEGLKSLGQFFTPRKVVRSIVQMSGVENLTQGQKVCDPFCGVGGFVLEPVNLYPSIRDNFLPRNGVISPEIGFYGFDKGFEKDEERTIILAKANMLIYLSDIVSKYNNLTTQFASVFNDVFTLQKESNLGTLKIILENEADKFDLIMTNPPYVTSGIRTLKSEIEDSTTLHNFYRVNGSGIEGLALEWIIRSLKKGGKAFVIVPDGIMNRLNDKKIRKFILDECFLDGIISLPHKTFFATPKKTYILALTKKHSSNQVQDTPVFTYFVSNIGETLDVNRFEIPENDLEEMVILFNQFKGAKKHFASPSKRCKVWPVSEFEPTKHWSVDRWWTKEEKIDLGIEEQDKEIGADELNQELAEAKKLFAELQSQGSVISNKPEGAQEEFEFKEISLGDEALFSLGIGKRVLRSYLFENRDNEKATIPLYSANVNTPFGYLEQSNIDDFEKPQILWGIDGNFDLNLKRPKEVFATTDHCGTIKVLNEKIDPDYLLYQLELKKYEYGFDRGLRSNLENVRQVVIDIPVNSEGEFDLSAQRILLKKILLVKKLQSDIQALSMNLQELADQHVTF